MIERVKEAKKGERERNTTVEKIIISSYFVSLRSQGGHRFKLYINHFF